MSKEPLIKWGHPLLSARLVLYCKRRRLCSSRLAHLYLQATIPANSSATLILPTDSGDIVTESGVPVQRAPGVRFVRTDANSSVFELAPGSYRFEASGK